MTGLFVTLFATLIGLGIVMYGRSQRRAPHLGVGLTLMICPQVVDGTLAVAGITLGGIALLVILSKSDL